MEVTAIFTLANGKTIIHKEAVLNDNVLHLTGNAKNPIDIRIQGGEHEEQKCSDPLIVEINNRKAKAVFSHFNLNFDGSQNLKYYLNWTF